jgi:hypothetical protein
VNTMLSEIDDHTGLKRVHLIRVNEMDAWDLFGITEPFVVSSEGKDWAVMMRYDQFVAIQEHMAVLLNKIGDLRPVMDELIDKLPEALKR